MPRTTTLETPGCPPIRTLTFDSLGFIKVIESRGDRAIPQVVERWGHPDASKCVLAVSIDDCTKDPVLAVGRKNAVIEVLNPLNGEAHASISHIGDPDGSPEDDAIAGLHLIKRLRSSGSCSLLSCTTKGNASIRSIEFNSSLEDNADSASPETWKVCGSGSIICFKVDESENYALFGGKSVEVNLWDLEKRSKIWTAKSPPKNSLGIFTPTWFTSATFLNKDDHHKFAAGTNSHQVRLYDTSAQRRPVISFDFRETPIKAVTADQDGHTIYVGNGTGDLASFDIRTGKLLGCFLGKCSGSIRSIARHPDLPVIASCGLDSYLRLWDVNTRQLLSSVFLKQHLTNVVFDSNFASRDVTVEAQNTNGIENEDDTGMLPVKRKKKSKEKDRIDNEDEGLLPVKTKKKSKEKDEMKKSREKDVIENEDDTGTLPVKRKKKSKEKDRVKNEDDDTVIVPVKRKKKSKENVIENGDDMDTLPVKRKKKSKEKDAATK
ncbi:Transducin/WD40 repeat-like superfamily protein [Euphorbia peplus]|nr:Transducin/WD40 repeat-like superfamily protein [Euphorbia peplus]